MESTSMDNPLSETVLITGITGFLGSQIANNLLNRGFKVKGTVRSLKNKEKLSPIYNLPNQNNLQLVEANLLDETCWDNIVSDVTYILHVASPFFLAVPKNEDEIIQPAVKGTMSVLKAAAKNDKIKHIVITSSIASIFSCFTSGKKNYTEEDWPNMDKIMPYNKSKTLAEKEAWNFYKKEKEIREKSNKKMFKLTTICPGYIFGPSLIKTGFASGDIIRQILTGEILGIPNVKFCIVDVRDCAESHIRAMLSDITDGQRYICASEKGLWARDISKLLINNYGKYGYKCTKMNVPNFLIRMYSLFNGQAAATYPLLDADNNFDNSKIKRDLKITFKTPEEAILSMAKSLIDLGIVENLIDNQNKMPK